jgi:non-specific serine/threonine protein kinase
MDPAELRKARQALRLTQVELARALGATPNTLARWERGELQIRHPELVQLALQRMGNASPAPLHNLPQELNSFVGREREERELSGALSTTRLLTLTGPGGVGKTRLAQRIARASLPEHAGGVWFVDLGPVTDSSLVARAVSGTLRIREAPGQDIPSTIAATLANSPVLLLLDNCEHLVEACARLVARLLQSSNQLRVLATSREPLGVDGETVRRLPPLSLPDSRQARSPELLVSSGAIQLLLERATAHGAPISPAENGPDLVAICMQLDGLPLALELAAAHLPALGPLELARQLQDALNLPVGTRRDAPARHSTLWATIDWSYALLSPAERQLFSALAAFAGDWSLEACEGIVAGDGIDRGDVVALLSRLVDRSLVVAEPRAGGTIRYRLMETVRQYAWKRLQQSGGDSLLRARHCDWFIGQAPLALRAAHGPAEAHEFARLETDLVNLRTALDWLVTGPSPSEHACGVIARLWWFWQTIGYYREGRQYLERLLDHADGTMKPKIRAEVLAGAAMLAWNQRGRADLEAARRYHEEALSIRRALGRSEAIGESLAGLARTLRDQGYTAAATRLLEESLELRRAAGDRFGVARTLNGLALTAMHRHEFVRAMEYFAESLELSRQMDDPAGVATELGNMASLAYEQGDFERAGSLASESLTLRRDLGVRWSQHATFDVVAGLVARRGDAVRAARLFGASDRLREEAGQTLERRPSGGQTHHLRDVASARTQLGADRFAAARAIGRSMPLEQAIADALEGLGTVRLESLTRREAQVAALVARGLTNRQIATELIVTEATAAKHVEHIRAKLGARSRSQIASWMTERSSIPVS